jgi:hypothetical protein
VGKPCVVDQSVEAAEFPNGEVDTILYRFFIPHIGLNKEDRTPALKLEFCFPTSFLIDLGNRNRHPIFQQPLHNTLSDTLPTSSDNADLPCQAHLNLDQKEFPMTLYHRNHVLVNPIDLFFSRKRSS